MPQWWPSPGAVRTANAAARRRSASPLTRPGPARDRVVAVLDTWQSLLRQCLLDALACGEIDHKAEIAQVVFEVQAMLLAGNLQFVLRNDPVRLTQARKGVEHVLARIAVGDGPRRKRSARGSP